MRLGQWVIARVCDGACLSQALPLGRCGSQSQALTITRTAGRVPGTFTAVPPRPGSAAAPAYLIPIVDRSPGRLRPAVPLFRPGRLPGPGWRAVASDDLPPGLFTSLVPSGWTMSRVRGGDRYASPGPRNPSELRAYGRASAPFGYALETL